MNLNDLTQSNKLFFYNDIISLTYVLMYKKNYILPRLIDINLIFLMFLILIMNLWQPIYKGIISLNNN